MKVKIYTYDTGDEKLVGERYLDEAFEQYACQEDQKGDGAYNAAVRHLEREGRFWISATTLLIKK